MSGVIRQLHMARSVRGSQPIRRTSVAASSKWNASVPASASKSRHRCRYSPFAAPPTFVAVIHKVSCLLQTVRPVLMVFVQNRNVVRCACVYPMMPNRSLRLVQLWCWSIRMEWYYFCRHFEPIGRMLHFHLNTAPYFHGRPTQKAMQSLCSTVLACSNVRIIATDCTWLEKMCAP